MYSIKQLRSLSGLTQKEFANMFHIPLRTIQKWETGASTPPSYLLELIEYKLNKEMIVAPMEDMLVRDMNKVNLKTIVFIDFLNRLADYTDNEADLSTYAKPWSKYPSESYPAGSNDFIYDDTQPLGLDDEFFDPEFMHYEIISMCCTDAYGLHHDVISTYSEDIKHYYPDAEVHYVVDSCNADNVRSYIEVYLNETENKENDTIITIENGRWYISS